jgi:NADH:ubiquinone oxidoreductase subunit D
MLYLVVLVGFCLSLHFPFILSLINELKLSIESSKGIYTIYPNCFPYYNTNIIPIDYPTINQPNKFCRSINLGDPIAILGSIDFVSGSVDLKVNLSVVLD